MENDRFLWVADNRFRMFSWNLLRQLASYDINRWVCFGDFNEILWNDEKEGGRLRPENQMKEFTEALEDCKLQDLGYTGYMHTWRRGNSVDFHVRERLDRVVATNDWRLSFPNAIVQNLSISVSKHSPISLRTEGAIKSCRTSVGRGVKS